MTRERVQLGVAALFVVVAVVSAVWRFGPTWRYLSHQHSQFAGYSAVDRAEAPGYANALPVDAFDFFRDQLSRHDRYFVVAPPGAYIAGVDRPTALRTFARYYLLPAIQVERPDRASAIVSVGVDPRGVGVPVTRVVRDGQDPFWVARVRR